MNIPFKYFWGITFCRQPKAAIVPLVREFYANAAERDDGKSIVRGKLVSFDVDALNSLLETHAVDDHLYQNLKVDPDYNEIIEQLCREGATWHDSFSYQHFSERFLLLESATWYAFVAKRMVPISHTSDVTTDRANLLYALNIEWPINVGRLIHGEIRRSIHTTSIGLYFPTIITELCIKAGVQPRADEEWIQPVDKAIVKKKEAKRKNDFPPRGGASSSTATAIPSQPKR